MTDAGHRELEQLVPWLATGTLPAAEAARVEAHVATCEGCRALLAQARVNVDLARAGPIDRHVTHVSARLLTEFAESPESLERETRDWIADRLHECGDCRAAYERLLDVEHALAGATEDNHAADRGAGLGDDARPLLGRAWDALAGTVLHPVPALAYLLLLVAVAIPALRGTVTPAPGTAGSPFVVTLEADRQVRDGDATPPPAPVVFPADPSRPLLLRLELGVPADSLRELAPACRVEVSVDGTTIHVERHPTDEVAEEAGGAVLYALVDGGTLRPGREHEIVVRASKPGSAVDGRTLLRRAIALSR